jgi:hypothetical protein
MRNRSSVTIARHLRIARIRDERVIALPMPRFTHPCIAHPLNIAIE